VGYHLKDIDLEKIKKPIVKKGYNKTITNEDIDLINDLRKEGKTYLEIAKIIGCGKSTVFIHIRDENKNLLKDENEEQRSRRKSLYV
ncbi:hypothetical protein M3M33_15120, partial [Loigolactobacillus coryniformis]|uniref:hypothetical protein n=1 Tax=Loigolactobacillus coryniformis TaxID=1610 RepID=UPI00201AC5F9